MRAVFAAPEQMDDTQFVVDELHEWLMGDADLRRSARISRISRGTTGTMGVTDVVEVVVGQGIAALNLAIAYATWRSTRPRPPGIVVTLPGGTLTVTDDSPEALARILEVLRHEPGTQVPGGTGQPRLPGPVDASGAAARPEDGDGDGTG
ncbi:effector-associated constant component EACC1 [Streptomyces sp. NPDC003435]